MHGVTRQSRIGSGPKTIAPLPDCLSRKKGEFNLPLFMPHPCMQIPFFLEEVVKAGTVIVRRAVALEAGQRQLVMHVRIIPLYAYPYGGVDIIEQGRDPLVAVVYPGEDTVVAGKFPPCAAKGVLEAVDV